MIDVLNYFDRIGFVEFVVAVLLAWGALRIMSSILGYVGTSQDPAPKVPPHDGFLICDEEGRVEKFLPGHD